MAFLERLLVFLSAIWKPFGMAEMKLLCAFIKGGTRSVIRITNVYIFGANQL
jgi:hypothetical protein